MAGIRDKIAKSLEILFSLSFGPFASIGRDRRPFTGNGVPVVPKDLADHKARWKAWATAHDFELDQDGDSALLEGRRPGFEVRIDVSVVRHCAQPVVVLVRGPSPFQASVWFRRRRGRRGSPRQEEGRPPQEAVANEMARMFERVPGLVSYRFERGAATLRFEPLIRPAQVDDCLASLDDLVRAGAGTYRG